jgi:hypothetical protein
VASPVDALAPLVLLPVVWVALYGARWQLLAVVSAVPIVLAGSVLASGGDQWLSVGVLSAGAALLGYVVQRVIGGLRRAAAASRRDLDERLRTERRIGVEAEVTRVLGESATLDEALPRCLEALGHGLAARVALLWRPDPVGRELRCSAAW